MAMLIRNGLLYTMTAQGSFVGDVLISGGRILRVEERISDTEDFETCTIDATGLTILPGLIDPCIRTGGGDPAWLVQMAAAAGVTTGLLLPEEGDAYTLMEAGRLCESCIQQIYPARMGEESLTLRLKENHASGKRTLCHVRSEAECRKVLQAAQASEATVILTGVETLERLAEEIARAGVTVVIGVDREGPQSPWRVAAELEQAGVPVALSCRYPAAKMKLLPVCASLCVRDGMAREHALQAITCHAADALGLGDRGRIEAGSCADLAIFDGDPLLLATSHVATVLGGVIQGRFPRKD